MAWGQISLLNEAFGKGLWLTFLSCIPLVMAMLGEERLLSIGRQVLAMVEIMAEKAKAWEKKSKAKTQDTAKSIPVAASGIQENVGREKLPSEPVVSEEKVKNAGWKNPLRFVPDPLAALKNKELKIPRQAPLILGILLILAAQPFLFTEEFFFAIALVLPGLLLFVSYFIKRGPFFVIRRLDVAAKTALLGLPGTLLIVIGNILLVKYVQLYWQKELLGLSCNALGILMLLWLMPAKFDDPDQGPGNPWDDYADEAKSLWGLLGKGLLAVGAMALFYLARHFAGSQKLWHALWSTLAGLALIQLSFPWKLAGAREPKPLVLPLKLLLNLARLVAFVLAIWFAFHGQKLMAGGQIMPALFKFVLATAALVLAIREPEPGREDLFKEAPLKWYWELMGLVIVMGLAIWLRTHLLNIIPYGIEGDEAAGHVNANELFKGPNFSIIAHPAGQAVFYLAHLRLSELLFGLNNLGIKFHALYYGVLDILALFLFARMLYGPRTALLTSLLLALSRWHIHFSRFGYGNTLLILLLMLGFYFFLKALKTRRKWYFVLAGMGWSYALQTEVSARLLPIICLVIMGYLMVRQRHFLTRNWKPLLALFLGVWLVGSGMLILFGKSSTALLGRAESVSIFSQDPNAPTRNIAAGLIGSIKSSLTMLNYRGDFRTRHNGGLSGEPQLDFWTGLLFMLGFGFSVYYWKRLRYFVPLVWFFGFMCASIFAIEAPQAHRAFGIVPAVFLMIGAFLDRSRRLLQETLGRVGLWLGVAAMIVLLVVIGRINYKKYFDTWPGFDTNCTAAAKFIGRVHPQAENYVMSAYLWQGHPPFLLYAGKASAAFYYASSEVVPVTKDTKRDILYTAILEYGPIIDTIKLFYPKGEYKEEVHPKYGLQFRSWFVKNKDMMATRGLTARYYSNLNWQGQPAVVRKDEKLDMALGGKTWPLAGKGSVSWKGTVFVPHEGYYKIYLFATDSLEVTIGKNSFRASGSKTDERKVWLSGGLNKLTARAIRRSAQSRIVLSWSCDQAADYYLYKDKHQQAFAEEPIPENYYFTYKEPLGLLGTFYNSNNWTGDIFQERVEPVLLFGWMGRPCGFSPPLSAEWRGTIIIDEPGDYKFNLDCGGFGEVKVAGSVVWQRGTPPEHYPLAQVKNKAISLEKGRYPVQVRWIWQNTSIFKFWWTTPEGKHKIVPASVLRPAEK